MSRTNIIERLNSLGANLEKSIPIDRRINESSINKTLLYSKDFSFVTPYYSDGKLSLGEKSSIYYDYNSIFMKIGTSSIYDKNFSIAPTIKVPDDSISSRPFNMRLDTSSDSYIYLESPDGKRIFEGNVSELPIYSFVYNSTTQNLKEEYVLKHSSPECSYRPFVCSIGGVVDDVVISYISWAEDTVYLGTPGQLPYTFKYCIEVNPKITSLSSSGVTLERGTSWSRTFTVTTQGFIFHTGTAIYNHESVGSSVSLSFSATALLSKRIQSISFIPMTTGLGGYGYNLIMPTAETNAVLYHNLSLSNIRLSDYYEIRCGSNPNLIKWGTNWTGSTGFSDSVITVNVNQTDKADYIRTIVSPDQSVCYNQLSNTVLLTDGASAAIYQNDDVGFEKNTTVLANLEDLPTYGIYGKVQVSTPATVEVPVGQSVDFTRSGFDQWPVVITEGTFDFHANSSDEVLHNLYITSGDEITLDCNVSVFYYQLINRIAKNDYKVLR